MVTTCEKGINGECETVHTSHPVGPDAKDAITIDSASGCEIPEDTNPTAPRGGPLNLDAPGLVKGRVGVPPPNFKVKVVPDNPHVCKDIPLPGARNGR